MKPTPNSDEDKSTSEDSGTGDDKPASDELTKELLVNLPYGYNLWNQLTKRRRSSSNNSNRITISRRREIDKTLLVIYASPKAGLVASQIWDLKAFTTEELMTLTKFSSRVIDHTRNNLIRIGLVRKTNIELKKAAGKKGPKPHVYAIGIANTNDRDEAKLRYDEIVKQEELKNKSDKKEELRKTAEERQLKAEARNRLRDSKVQVLITEFTGIYQKTKLTIPLQEIDKKAKIAGLSDYNAFLEIAVALEENGIQTGYFVNGKLDSTAKVSPKILEIRKRLEAQQ